MALAAQTEAITCPTSPAGVYVARVPIVLMKLVLYLLIALAILGAFDTLYYHEWRARLPALGRSASSELRLHALRDFVYAILFIGLPWLAWQGMFVFLLATFFLIEVTLTLWDFVIEDWVRKPLGGVYPGERVMHAIMGIVYGALLAYVVPIMRLWWSQPTRLRLSPAFVAEPLRWLMVVMAIGVFLSGVRDLCAAEGLPGSAWPWATKAN
jgi:hypothetical protein